MKIYHLYQTGILVATLHFKENYFTIEMRNFLTGKLENETIFDPIIHGEFLNRYIRTDFLTIIQNFTSYQQFVADNLDAKEELITLDPFNATYHKYTDTLWVQRHKKEPTDLVIQDNRLVGFVFTNREFASVFIEEGYEKDTVIQKWKEHQMMEEHPCPVLYKGIFNVPMRDGVHLSTIVYLPKTSKKEVPIIFVRTPYGKESYCEAYFRFVQRGFGVVVQDTRGRSHSEGVFSYNGDEEQDGADALAWIAAQEWCDSNIGMFGASYGGYVQWSAAASGTPHLKAIVSTVTSGGPFTDVTRMGGTHSSGLAWWFAMSKKFFDRELMNRNDWDDIMKIRPLQKIPEIGLGYSIEAFNELLEHDAYDEYYEKMDWVKRKKNINVPALIVSGWYDDNEAGSTEAISVVQQYAPNRSKIVLGPWLHNGNSRRDLGNLFVGCEAIRHDIDFLHISWFNRFLKHIENGIEKTPALEYYTIQENKWKTSTSWPPTNSKYIPYYFGKQEKNNHALLTIEPTTEENMMTYQYDPKHPAPHLIDVSENELSFPNDYREIEQRSDVVTYSTESLIKDTVVTGSTKVSFFAKTDVVNTDWVIRLTDVAPDGTSYQVAMNCMNARFRDSWEAPSLLEPGKVYKYDMQLSKTSYCFKKGHRIRIHITSSAENYIYTNSNTEQDVHTLDSVIATQQIISSPDYPSVVYLPIEE